MPKGKYVKIRPHLTAFVELPDPKAMFALF